VAAFTSDCILKLGFNPRMIERLMGETLRLEQERLAAKQRLLLLAPRHA
jgi:hypothetical protein